MAAFMRVFSLTKGPGAQVGTRAPLVLSEVYRAHADFVYRSLARLGVRNDDLPDMLQEVFLVVHRRAESFDGSSKLTSWLFGICLRVAARYRRRPYLKREQPLASELNQECDDAVGPDQELEAKRARAVLERVLDAMPLTKRAIFVMFEIDGLSSREIAATLDVPLGTVHSRLHAARAAFATALERVKAEARRQR